jgi:hypothetical protein
MLGHKKDIYADYSEKKFLDAFSAWFRVEKSRSLPGSLRKLFLMKLHQS